jgi:hypothetical protein
MKKHYPVSEILSLVLASLITILFFLARKELLSSFIYSLAAMLTAFYFFPLKFLIFRQRDPETKGRFIYAATDPFITYIIAASIATLFDVDRFLGAQIFFLVLGLINTFLLFYHYFKNSRRYWVAIHVIFSMLIAMIFVI